MNAAELTALLPDWIITLRAQRKQESTISAYVDSAKPYLAWCAERPELDPLDRITLSTWVAELMSSGRQPSTARTRLNGVQRFTGWLAAEGEIDADPFVRMEAPKVDMPVIPVLTDDELRALIAACQPPAAERSGLASLRHKRDEAIVRVMVETGMRASECVGLRVDDVDLTERTAVIRRGKGGRGRTVAFGPNAAQALSRYLRVRRLHRHADNGVLWLGDRSGPMLTYSGLHKLISKRGAAAGIDGLHPHMLRHTSTDRWLAAGGSEQGAMAMHGWAKPDMLQRYGRANRERRAIAEARQLDLGDF
jgi:site-specific recombinase XerD